MNETQQYFLNTISHALTGTPCETMDDKVERSMLFSIAQEQKLTAVIFSKARNEFPPEEQRLWRIASLQQVALQAQRTETFLEVYKALAERGFSPLVVKGILCRQTYPEPDARISSDEDLYIPREQYPDFHRAMLQLGFSAEEPDYQNAHEERFFKENMMIEGHWELFPQEHSTLNALNVLNGDFWKRCTTQELEEISLRVLEPTDHMTFLLLHAFKHFINSGVGIRQLCDVAQWSKAHDIDWHRVQETMRLARAESFASAVFDAGEKYFGMKAPQGWPQADCAALLKDAFGGGVYGTTSMSRKHSGSMTLAAVEDAEQASRTKSLLRTIFPNRAVMERSFPWVKKNKALLPVAWTLRIWRYLKSRGEGNFAAESLLIGTERLELLREYNII